jgi:diketogulonate reductase-like aldo/keto reductase
MNNFIFHFILLTCLFTYASTDTISNKFQINFDNDLESKASIDENDFFDFWENHPTQLYASLLQRKINAESSDNFFLLPEMLISVQRIKSNIDKRLSSKSELKYLNDMEINILKCFSTDFNYIIDNDIPYKNSVETIFLYLDFMDGIFKRLYPSLPNSIAKLLTEEKFLNLTSQKDVILFFSFRPVDIDFFVRTRPTPIYIIGLIDYPSFENPDQAKIKVDGYFTEIGGFAHHDAEHARADWKLDSNLLKHRNPEALVQEWQHNRDLIQEKINQLKVNDPDLARAAMILLFEILHERGLQYDLSILKSYLNLPLFSKTTKDKWLSLFWDPLPGKYELYDIFDKAENWLDHQVSELLIQQNKENLAKSHSLISTIEKITMNDGFVQRVEILEEDDVRVWLNESLECFQENQVTSLYNIKTFGLVEVDPLEEDFVPLPGKSHFLQTKFNQLLKLWKNRRKLSYKVVEPSCFILDKLIKIDENSQEAFFEKGDEIYRLKLDSILISDTQGRYPMKIQNLRSTNLFLPMAALGTYKLDKEGLIRGLKNGFQLIDTAKAYENEELVGSAIKASGIPLDCIKIITKLFRPNLENRETLRQAIFDSAEKIGKVPEVILIHGPYPDVGMISLVQELESMKKEGLIQNWGVSNFDIDHLALLLEQGLRPALNQVEFHPFFQRTELLKYCKEHDIVLQAYRPIAQGKALEDATIKSIAQSHHITPATLIYSWFCQQNIPVVTKVSSSEHQKEYADSGQLLLTNEEMTTISKLNYPDEKGRTSTKGGWWVPFTKEISDKWLEDSNASLVPLCVKLM